MIFESVNKNKTKTSFIVILFFILIGLFVYFLTYIFGENSQISFVIATIATSITSIISYYASDKIELTKYLLSKLNSVNRIKIFSGGKSNEETNFQSAACNLSCGRTSADGCAGGGHQLHRNRRHSWRQRERDLFKAR